ncbi:MAG: hypothetical protein ACPG7F_18010, partial [Aggregatilineales bacterium]
PPYNVGRGFRGGECLLLIIILLTACTQATPVPTTTPVVISKFIATVYVSPTPDTGQIAATRAAQSPTPAPVTPSATPTETPYVGQFIGRADRDEGFEPINAPFFASDASPADPTADAGRCFVPIEQDYLGIWQRNQTVRDSLGCPIQAGSGFFGESQIFENGVIYYRPDTREVWALLPGGRQGDYRFLEAPENVSTAGIQPPQGLLVPSGDIGSLWAGIDGLSDDLGFAQTSSQRTALNLQRMETGTFLLDATQGQIFALAADGGLNGPYEALPIDRLLPVFPAPITIEPAVTLESP